MEEPEKESLLFRTALIFTLIAVAAALRLAPHPWNFTPVGAMALFAGATVRDRRLALLFPLLVMFATDLIIGFNQLSPLVYTSFALSVVIGRAVAADVVGVRFSASQPKRVSARSVSAKSESARLESARPETAESERPSATPRKLAIPRIAAATFLAALQFFLITNFGVWAFLNTYPRTAAGLAACYLAGLPLFGNTLAGDATYAALLFGALFLAERFAPRLRPSAPGSFHA